jgi:hypothetical protein
MAENGKRFPWNMDMTPKCDQCGKNRAHGNHIKCSRIRQALAAKGREQAGVGGNQRE